MMRWSTLLLSAPLVLALNVAGALPDDAIALNEKASKALAEGRPAEAVLLLESARRQMPHDEVLKGNLAWAYFQRGQNRQAAFDDTGALSDFRLATETYPSEPGYALHLTNLALQQYRLAEALSAVDEALELHPEHAQLHLLRGDVLNLLDELDGSVEAYERAVKLGEGDIRAAAQEAHARAARQANVERDYASHASDTFLIRHPQGTDFLDLLTGLDRARVEVCQALDAWPASRALVVLYPPDAFRAVTGTHDWVGGLFDRKIRLPIGDTQSDAGQVEAAFRHEFAHLLVSERNPRCPTFLNEGLAQWVEFGRGQGLERLVDHLRAVGMSTDELPRIEELPTSFVSVADRGQVMLSYLLSYAFVDYLVEHQGSGAPLRWVRELRRAPIADAYAAATRRSFERDEEQFRESVRVALGH
ncbi:MAG: lipoprotein [Planctomycetota bacterium]|nr:MAG: lipoprotein [Planctomycetota bacterium]